MSRGVTESAPDKALLGKTLALLRLCALGLGQTACQFLNDISGQVVGHLGQHPRRLGMGTEQAVSDPLDPPALDVGVILGTLLSTRPMSAHPAGGQVGFMGRLTGRTDDRPPTGGQARGPGLSA